MKRKYSKNIVYESKRKEAFIYAIEMKMFHPKIHKILKYERI